MLISILTTLLILSFLVAIHEYGHYRALVRAGVYCPTFAIGFGPTLLKFKSKKTHTEFCFKPILLGGYVQPATKEDKAEEAHKLGLKYLEEASYPERMLVLSAGVIVNFLFGIILLFITLVTIGLPVAEQKVTKVVDNYPIEQAGITENDVIYRINDNYPLRGLDTKQEQYKFSIRRGNENKDYFVTPIFTDNRYIFGYQYMPINATYARQSFAQAADQTIKMPGTFIAEFAKTFSSFQKFKENSSGIVGITNVTNQVIYENETTTIDKIYQIIMILVSISISLAIFNLLPIPALDGGQILILTIERIIKRELNEKVKNTIAILSFALLLGLIIFVTGNDIQKLLGG